MWSESWPAVSGRVVVEIFRDAALSSWAGAEALIDAYMELEEKTGEGPSRKYVDEEMYLRIKEYWGNELDPQQLNKLDIFLSRFNE